MGEPTMYYSGTCPGCGTHWNLKASPRNSHNPNQIKLDPCPTPNCTKHAVMTLIVVNG